MAGTIKGVNARQSLSRVKDARITTEINALDVLES